MSVNICAYAGVMRFLKLDFGLNVACFQKSREPIYVISIMNTTI